MKRNFLFILTILFFSLCSCDREDDLAGNKNGKYLSYLKDIILKADYGDFTLKAAPSISGREMGVYTKFRQVPGFTWSLVDGTEFLPNSDAYNDWIRPNVNPAWFSGSSGTMLCTFCPANTNVRFVVKCTIGSQGTAVGYLGIHDVIPTADGFTFNINCRRVGDLLKVNMDQLISKYGSNGFNVKVTYTKSIIDINKTIQSSPSTDSSWPVYVYSSSSQVTKTMSGSGDVVVYEDIDAKVTGAITVTLTVGSKVTTQTTQSANAGTGLVLVLVPPSSSSPASTFAIEKEKLDLQKATL